MTTLTNSFHGSEYRTRLSNDEIERRADVVNGCGGNVPTPAEKAWVRKVQNTLCGISDCCCGDILGRRE